MPIPDLDCTGGEAKDLEALRDAVVDAAGVGVGPMVKLSLRSALPF
jgi:hypothetical protein